MIVDTGILLAAADRDDPHHREANAALFLPDLKIVPEPVVVETEWALAKYLGIGAELAFLRDLIDDVMAVESPARADRIRACELLDQYRDARIGYVNAVTVAIAERLKESRIATLDRRPFTMIRPRHIEAFELVP